MRNEKADRAERVAPYDPRMALADISSQAKNGMNVAMSLVSGMTSPSKADARTGAADPVQPAAPVKPHDPNMAQVMQQMAQSIAGIETHLKTNVATKSEINQLLKNNNIYAQMDKKIAKAVEQEGEKYQKHEKDIAELRSDLEQFRLSVADLQSGQQTGQMADGTVYSKEQESVAKKQLKLFLDGEIKTDEEIHVAVNQSLQQMGTTIETLPGLNAKFALLSWDAGRCINTYKYMKIQFLKICNFNNCKICNVVVGH